MRKITDELIKEFKCYLANEEKSLATLEKYVRDITAFKIWVKDAELCKAVALKYKEEIVEKYAPASVNSILSSLNSFFDYNGWYDLKVKAVKIQKQIFANKNRELTKAEYERLLLAAKRSKKERLYYVMQTICATGIRVSELKFITVDTIKRGQANINCKGKVRVVILPKQLCKMLKGYAEKNKIANGSIFVTKSGKSLDRSNIWSDMKKLCKEAGVECGKVFPHNLRHLFARTYYSIQKDVVKLADILGHTSINTTRIYTMETGDIFRKQIQTLGLLRC